MSAKIATTQTKLDKSRTTSRRLRLLWTLYLGFAYLVYAIVLILVVGWKNMGVWEWSGMAAGPVVLYLIRAGTAAFFNYRIESLSARLKEQQEERAKTIQKLKDATKYDSTLELLEKYGGAEPKPKKGKKNDVAETADGGRQQGPATGSQPGTPSRTSIPPPATANIRRREGMQQFMGDPPVPPSSPSAASRDGDTSAEFAPNAFGAPGSPATTSSYYQPHKLTPAEARWYDRILDVILGEDETAPQNRIALVCSKCRLVNGQAPPGTKELSDFGPWRCMQCGTMNGELSPGKRIVKEILEEEASAHRDPTDDEGGEGSSDLIEVEKDDISDSAAAEEPAKSEPVRKRRKEEELGGKLRPRAATAGFPSHFDTILLAYTRSVF